MTEDDVGNRIRSAAKLLQRSWQQFADGGWVPVRDQSGRGAATQIEDDVMALLVGGQESAEWNLKQIILVNRAG
jgi:hypothetical protein